MAQTDLFIQTKRERHVVALAARLAAQVAPRAAEHDRANTFPTESFDDLRAAGYHLLTVPKEAGGFGASLTELLLAQERLAQGDGATALTIGWHLAAIGKQREIQGWPEAVLERLCREAVAEGALLNGLASEVETGSPSRGGRPTTTAERTPSGYRLTGRKAFCSGAPVLRYGIVSAGVEGEPNVGWFLVDLRAPGVQIYETWDVLGMRATGSHDIGFDQVALPADAMIESIQPRPAKVPGGGNGWLLHIPAVYLGIARAAREVAVSYAQSRRTNALSGTIGELPHVQILLGEIEAELLAARASLYAVARRWDAAAGLGPAAAGLGPASSGPEASGDGGTMANTPSEALPDEREALVPLVGAAKHLATNAAIRVVDKAMRVLGIAGLSRSGPLERLYRDVRAGLSNPPMEDSILINLAKAALALPVSKEAASSP